MFYFYFCQITRWQNSITKCSIILCGIVNTIMSIMKDLEKAERNPRSPVISDQNHIQHVVIINSKPVNRNFPAGHSGRILMLLCYIIWASLPVSKDSWQYCKNLAANSRQSLCFGQYFNLWCFLHVESYLLIHVQPVISCEQSSFPVSPGQQQEGERGLNVLASCGEAKAVRIKLSSETRKQGAPICTGRVCSLQGHQRLRKPSLASALQGQGCGMFTHLVYLWTLPWGDTECKGSDSLQWATLLPLRLCLHYVGFRASIYKKPLLWRKMIMITMKPINLPVILSFY